MNPLSPLILVSPATVPTELGNLIASRQPRIRVTSGEREDQYLVGCGTAVAGPVLRFKGKSAERDVILSVATECLDRMAPADIAPQPLQELPEPLATALGRMALGPMLAGLDGVLGQPVALQGIADDVPANWSMVSLCRAEAEEASADATLHLSPEAEAAVLEVLRARPPDASHALGAQLPVQVWAAMGWQRLTQADLARLVPGAVVLMRGAEGDAPHVRLFSGASFALCGAGRVEGNAITIEQTMRDVMDEELEETPDMDETPDELQGAINVEDLTVRLDFVLGKSTLTFEQLQEVGPGTTLPLDEPATGEVMIVSSGRRVGWAEVVEIDGRIGARITRLNRRGDD